MAPKRTLVVGDGMAGALVAWELHTRGQAFVQWSDGSPAASNVAAGMFNPVSFRRILPQWEALEQQEEARACFQQIERAWGIVLWHEVPIVRIFPDETYAGLWRERAKGGHAVSPFIETLEASEFHASVQAPFGAGLVPQAGWVDVAALTFHSRETWKAAGRWEQRHWCLNDGCPEGFDAVIDCRGVGAVEDLAAFGLELRRNHGEVIRVKPAEDWGEHTVNNVTWALPMRDGTYRVGSTYRWDVAEARTLSETPNQLIQSVCEVRRPLESVELLDHEAGLRPSCFDRRPILGPVSPRHPYYHVCTGWGTRGVSIGPTMVRWVVDVLTGVRKDVPDEVHPRRFRTFTEN